MNLKLGSGWRKPLHSSQITMEFAGLLEQYLMPAGPTRLQVSDGSRCLKSEASCEVV